MHDHEIEAFSYAKSHALELLYEYKSYFNEEIHGLKYLSLISKLLGISMAKMEGTSIEGRLEIKTEGDVLIIDPYLNKNYKAFTIAHEIGHWILAKKYPELASKRSHEWKEKYATYFAYVILVPERLKDRLKSILDNAESVFTIVKLSNEYDLSITSILNSLKYGQYNYDEYGSTNVWIVAKWIENKFTKIDPKLRITSRYFNPTYCYIPINQGLDRIVLEMDVFSNLRTGQERKANCCVSINVRNRINQKPKYSKKVINASLSTMRLNESKWDRTSQIVILIHDFKTNDCF
jgi:Zn-dependent peptidase ImmA (M78 family)